MQISLLLALFYKALLCCSFGMKILHSSSMDMRICYVVFLAVFLTACVDYVNENEEHVREAAAQREQQREQWRKEAADLNPKAQAVIKEALGDDYETWYQHDILVGRNVLVNRELGKMYVQGIVIPVSEIMEVRQGRKDLKLVTSNSTYPFITIDFGALPINPETGNRYKDEIAQKIEALMA